jgi:hypothetical protein
MMALWLTRLPCKVYTEEIQKGSRTTGSCRCSEKQGVSMTIPGLLSLKNTHSLCQGITHLLQTLSNARSIQLPIGGCPAWQLVHLTLTAISRLALIFIFFTKCALTEGRNMSGSTSEGAVMK